MKNATGGTLPTIRVGLGTSRVTYSAQVGRLSQILSPNSRANLIAQYRAYQQSGYSAKQAAKLNSLIMAYRRQMMTKGVSGLSDIGMGAPDDIQPGNLADPALVAASDALASNLAANGCQPRRVQAVVDFQQAWLNSGGTLPSDTGGRSPVDGFYGANTAAALSNLHPEAPAGCVGPAGGGPTVTVGPITQTPNAAPAVSAKNPTVLFASMIQNPGQHWLAWMGLTAVALGLVAVTKKGKRGARGMRGRRGPARRRRKTSRRRR